MSILHFFIHIQEEEKNFECCCEVFGYNQGGAPRRQDPAAKLLNLKPESCGSGGTPCAMIHDDGQRRSSFALYTEEGLLQSSTIGCSLFFIVGDRCCRCRAIANNHNHFFHFAPFGRCASTIGHWHQLSMQLSEILIRDKGTQSRNQTVAAAYTAHPLRRASHVAIAPRKFANCIAN